MSVDYEKKLEEAIHRELLKLTERAAPETLAPRVLAKVTASAKLEEAIHARLTATSEHTAPENLVASVLSTIEARASRPWWRKPIPQWPRRNQYVFVTIMMAAVMAAVFGLTEIWPHDAIQEIPSQAAAAMEPIRPTWSILETLARAAGLVLSSMTQPWLIGIGVALVFIYLCCIGMGMAWYRVTFQKSNFVHA